MMVKCIFGVMCVVGLGVLAIAKAPPAPRPVELEIKEIKGAKVATQRDANRIAFAQYLRKMKSKIHADEFVTDVTIVRLGYGVPDFAADGDRVWEARAERGFVRRALRGIIWIHPETAKVHFVTGAWEPIEAKKKAEEAEEKKRIQEGEKDK